MKRSGMWRTLRQLSTWVAKIALKYWNYIAVAVGLSCVVLIVITCILTAQAVWGSPKEGALSSGLALVLTVLFGWFSLVGMLVAIAVLYVVRGVISHWTQVANNLVELINVTGTSLRMLTANPAFLQALSEDDFKLWSAQLDKALKNRASFSRIVVAFIDRPRLAVEMDNWSGHNEDTKRKWIQQIMELSVVQTARMTAEPGVGQSVYLVPLDVEHLPYFIACSEGGGSIFLRSEIKPNIQDSWMRGFMSMDPYITSGFQHVFDHVVALNGIVYEYRCSKCASKEGYVPDYCFEHDLLREGLLDANTFDSEPPPRRCPRCGAICGCQKKRISSLDDAIGGQLLEKILGNGRP